MADPADIGNSSENRKTAIDWAAKPAPWCWIGPQFAEEVRRIVGRPAKFTGGDLKLIRTRAVLTRRLSTSFAQRKKGEAKEDYQRRLRDALRLTQ